LRILLEIVEKFFPLKAYQRKLSESCLQQVFSGEIYKKFVK